MTLSMWAVLQLRCWHRCRVLATTSVQRDLERDPLTKDPPGLAMFLLLCHISAPKSRSQRTCHAYGVASSSWTWWAV